MVRKGFLDIPGGKNRWPIIISKACDKTMFYHNIITQKSWEGLTKLGKTCNFVLIGGWAAYLYTKTLKSKDIDILIEYEELGKLREIYNVTKNERLKKYEARREEIQIDIYLPYFSSIGIPVEDLMKQTSSFEGFILLKKEWLLALKIYVLGQRLRSAKGEKDFLDILSLFQTNIDAIKLLKIIRKYKLESALKVFLGILDERNEASELDLNRHKYRKLKTDIILSMQI